MGIAGEIEGNSVQIRSTEAIQILGLSGSKKGPQWVMGIPISRGKKPYLNLVENPTPVFHQVEAILASFPGEKHIDHLLITNRTAVRLFLEGCLTAADFENAICEKDTITLPHVSLWGDSFKVVICKECNLQQTAVVVS
jgi:hypothetical protein